MRTTRLLLIAFILLSTCSVFAQTQTPNGYLNTVDYPSTAESLKRTPPIGPYVNVDSLIDSGHAANSYYVPATPRYNDAYCFEFLPDGAIFKPYLAGVKESRLSAHLLGTDDDGFLFDGTMGGRVGVFRYGTNDPVMPSGFQFDIEASGQIRLDVPSNVDVRSVDFRGGLPLTFGNRVHQAKFGYYHLSSHLGDEFVINNPGFNRLNYSRDVLLFGYSYTPRQDIRLYAEAGWAFYSDISEPWEFAFGAEYVPMYDTGSSGAPFAAFHAGLRQEVDFGGFVSAQAGWAWRNGNNGRLFRIGAHYLNGESAQFSFFDDFEHQIGFGIWYDM